VRGLNQSLKNLKKMYVVINYDVKAHPFGKQLSCVVGGICISKKNNKGQMAQDCGIPPRDRAKDPK
jgi:hypothetical protein